MKATIQIVNCIPEDLPVMFSLYDSAIAYQKTVFKRYWQPFDPALVTREVMEGRQWKAMIDGQIAGIFLTADTDPQIWKEKEDGNALYLHRAVTNPRFRGIGFMEHIVTWSKAHALSKGKDFVRLDTWGDNERLVDYYRGLGFDYLGITIPDDPESLPAHYSCISLALLQMKVG